VRPKVNAQGNAREAAEKPVVPAIVAAAPLPEASDPLSAAVDTANLPQPAAYMNLKDAGTEMWFEIWSSGQGVYKRTDRRLIGQFCFTHERVVELQETIISEGMVTEGSQGQLVPHPAAKLLAEMETKLLKMSESLGLTPEARIRLGLNSVDLQSKLDGHFDQYT